MKTAYNKQISNDEYFQKVTDFFNSKGLRDENGGKIEITDLDTYLSYYDYIKELDPEKKYLELRQPMYRQLFDEANKLLREYQDEHHVTVEKVEDLATYFNALPILLNDLEVGPKFLRIPFEEDFFEIDTNTRLIKVPKMIADNRWVVGISGDNLAEILWFKIDRFFDGQDLAVCFPRKFRDEKDDTGYGQTYVQWKNGNLKGLDIVVYPEIDEEHIYFGWYLRTMGQNSGPLKAPGTVNFSIRFECYEGKQENSNEPSFNSRLLLSFNTQPAKFNVLENLMDKMKTDNTKPNPMTSFVPEDVMDQVQALPRFSTIFDNTLGQKAVILEDLPETAELDSNNEIKLTVEVADVPEGHTIGYAWYYNNALIPDQDKNQYIIQYTEGQTASITGDYYARIDRTNPQGQTRRISSDVTHVLKPSEIRFANEDPTVEKNVIYSEQVKLSTEVVKDPIQYSNEPTGTLHYNWYHGDLTTVDFDKNMESISTDQEYEVDSESPVGKYWVTVYNKHNGDKTDPPIISNPWVVKMPPATPTINSINFDPDTRTLTVDVTAPNDNSEDLMYRWYSMKYGSSNVEFEYGKTSYTVPEEHLGSIYACEVKQVVFGQSGSSAVSTIETNT